MSGQSRMSGGGYQNGKQIQLLHLRSSQGLDYRSERNAGLSRQWGWHFRGRWQDDKPEEEDGEMARFIVTSLCDFSL